MSTRSSSSTDITKISQMANILTSSPSPAGIPPAPFSPSPPPSRSVASSSGVRHPSVASGEDMSLFDKLTAYMDNKFGSTDSRIESVSDNVKVLSTTVEKNTGDIAKIRSEMTTIAENKRRLDELTRRMSEPALDIGEQVRKTVATEIAKLDRGARWETNYKQRSASLGSAPGLDESLYWKARRSIRCWPVPRVPGKDLGDLAVGFFEDKLLLPVADLPNDAFEYVGRIPGRRNARIEWEIVVIFKETHIRDWVHSFAPNLARWRTDTGGSVGVRLDIPNHLLGQFKNLEKHGATLRRTLGDGLKRHVRFDDAKMGLELNFRPPGEDSRWETVSAEEAARANSETSTVLVGRPVSRGEPPSTSRRTPLSGANATSVGSPTEPGALALLRESPTLLQFTGRRPTTSMEE